MTLKTSELVSVILPTYKEPLSWVKDAVNSILNQTYKNIELIVIVDNPERNDICEWIEELNDKSIILVVNELNLGIVGTLNRGIGICHGKYVARMDADDISLPDRVERQLNFLKLNECDLVGGNIEVFNEMTTITKSNLPNTCKKMRRHILKGGGIPHPTWLVKRNMYIELGGYRDIHYAEDYDFLIRAIIAGYKVGAVCNTCLRYRQNQKGISQDNKGEQKYISRLIQEQGRKNTIYDMDYISNRISESKLEIEEYKECYKYSRNIRNALVSRDFIGVLSQIFQIRGSFIRIIICDAFRAII